MKGSLLSTAWRGAAVLYALVVVVLTLLPSKQLAAWAPLARDRALDPGIADAVVQSVAVAGLLLLAAPIVLRALRGGGSLRVAPGLRLSRSLSLTLVVYVIFLAIVASAALDAPLWRIALDWLRTWLDAATDRLTAGHVMAYAGLGFLLALAWGRQIDPRLLGLLALALSGVLEALQVMVPGRSPNWWDLVSNGLGLLVGLAAGRLLTRRPRDTAPGAAARPHRRPRSGSAVRSAMRHG